MLVLDASNRIPVALVVVVQVRIAVAVEQVHVVRVFAIVLCRTPEVRFDAFVFVIPIAVPVASRQRRERIIIQ